MKKISTRNYRKHYIVNLMPTKVKAADVPYIATADEAANWSKWLRSLIRSLVTDPVIAKRLILKTDQLKKQGGLVATLQTVVLPLGPADITQHLVHLDLSYTQSKEVQLTFGGLDVTAAVANSDKLTGLVTRFLKELHASHEEYYECAGKDAFVEELYETDDIDVVIDEASTLRVQVDRSLTDYLLALNTRLRINA